MDLSPLSSTKGDGTSLVVVIGGYGGRSAQMASVVKQIREVFPAAGVLVPELPFRLTSFVDPNNVVQEIVKEINSWCTENTKIGTPYKNIIFVGYSAGGLIVRKVYVVACEKPRTRHLSRRLSRSRRLRGQRKWTV